MTDERRNLCRRARSLMENGYLVKFLLVGGASFAIDLGLLALLHEGGRMDLWIATPLAFLTSLVFNFFVQRNLTFQSVSGARVSFVKYATLVIFNVAATDVMVNLIADAGQPYTVGKVTATVATTAWNFLLYKHWIFKVVPQQVGEPLGLDSSVTPPRG